MDITEPSLKPGTPDMTKTRNHQSEIEVEQQQAQTIDVKLNTQSVRNSNEKGIEMVEYGGSQ